MWARGSKYNDCAFKLEILSLIMQLIPNTLMGFMTQSKSEKSLSRVCVQMSKYPLIQQLNSSMWKSGSVQCLAIYVQLLCLLKEEAHIGREFYMRKGIYKINLWILCFP